MRIAVTGLTGQVVSSLIEGVPNDVEMLALGRPQLDLSAGDAALAPRRSVRGNAIINAAYTQVDKAESEPELTMKVNGAGAGFVAETAAELGVPLLHLSTDYVFDGTLDRPYCEDDLTGPTGVYGRSKLEGEAQISARCVDCVILRTAWVYSPLAPISSRRCCVWARRAMKSASLPIKSAIRQMRSMSPIPIHSCEGFSI